jgi:hypothetical protein
VPCVAVRTCIRNAFRDVVTVVREKLTFGYRPEVGECKRDLAYIEARRAEISVSSKISSRTR